jgi:hypothetical protein
MTSRAGRALAAALLAGAAATVCATMAHAGPYVWDQDENGIDDRIESVQVLGYRFSFENADTLLRQRIEVANLPGGLAYGMYVVYDHPPTGADTAALTLIGLPPLTTLTSVPVVRTFGTFAQAQLARNNLAGVERVEAIPILYPELVDGAAAVAARDASERVFPAWTSESGAPDGQGVVVAILDTGVNDEIDGSYPGHESVAGRCVGGATIVSGNSSLDTPHGASMNPKDHGGLATRAHATHVCGIVLGTGGATGLAKGLAPGAKYVDVKALDDTGNGHAVAEAIDWCIANRNRNWGAGASYQGIGVINLSLSSLDPSDGNDVASRAAARAVELGIVVVASMGNEGGTGVPSPAAGDGVIAVGGWDVQRSGLPGDDLWPSFNPSGPRVSDGDADAMDELKPTLLAPGVAVLSADGDPGSDGAQYRRASGTSAAAAFVSGAVALLRSADPSASPAAIAALLTSTARRDLPGAPLGSGGADPRWRSTRGYGLLDAYAARLEQTQPQRTEVRRLVLGSSADGLAIEATLETMRERGTAFLVFERAPDVAGAPGTFAAIDSVPAAGDSSLADATNLTSYARSWAVPVGERGVAFWYRVAYTEATQRHATRARRYASPSGPAPATLEVTIVHNAYDNDVDAVVEAAGAVNGPVVVRQFPLPGSTAAASVDWANGISATGNVALTFRLPIPAAEVEGLLPPSPSTPWTLRVTEGGFLNRSGRVESFRVIHHAPGGDVIYTGAPAPALTFEGQETVVRIPPATVAVEPGFGTRAALWPNPVTAGETVTFVSERAAPEGVEIYDLSGRRIGRAALLAAGSSGFVAHWSARDASGEPLVAGVYFARIGGRTAKASRMVVLR